MQAACTNSQCLRSLRTLLKLISVHMQGVRHIALQGTQCVAATADGAVHVWDCVQQVRFPILCPTCLRRSVCKLRILSLCRWCFVPSKPLLPVHAGRA